LCRNHQSASTDDKYGLDSADHINNLNHDYHPNYGQNIATHIFNSISIHFNQASAFSNR